MNIKTDQEIETMREAGKRLATVLVALRDEVKIGVTTKSLDALAFKLIKKSGAEPAFLNYRPAGSKRAYPATLCASVNDGVVHGLPSLYVIRDSDVIKLDLGLKYGGWYVDSAITVGVGKLDVKTQSLIKITEEALYRAIEEARPGNTLGDIGWAVERHVRKSGFSVVKLLTGHGIGKRLHEEPTVLNFGERGEGKKLEVGMVLAIEPMVALGSGEIRQKEDDSFVTADGLYAAHFEHTIAITREGPRILTTLDN